MTPPRPHIIAASPSGMTSQPHDDDRSGSSRAGTNSAAGCGGEKTRYSFAETRRSILARLNGPPVHVTVRDEDLDADLRIIGIGLAAGVFFSVVLRLAQMGWLS